MALETFESRGTVRKSEEGPVWDSPRIKPMPLKDHFHSRRFPWA